MEPNPDASERISISDTSSRQWCKAVRRRLLRWGRQHYQPYAWRSETSPWLSLAAEIMLQRTRAQQVEPVYLELRSHYPTAADLVRAGEEATAQITARIGLHWRGHLLYEAAKAVSEAGGIPPDSLPQLKQLPGVGPYTRGAWLSMYRGIRAPIIDANIARWLARMVGKPCPRDPRHVKWVNELSESLTPSRAFRDYNYAVLDFTMMICTSRQPHCPECPLRKYCEYGRHNII